MNQETGLSIITPRNVVELRELATLLGPAATLPDALRGKPADIMAIIMTGAELGFGPMQSMRTLVVIKGKPTLSASAQVALVKSSQACKYFRLVSSDAKSAVYETLRVGDPSPTSMAFTMAEAQQAGIAGPATNYARYPAAMLRARASSALAQAVYPDVTLGLYATEDVIDEPDAIEGVFAPAPTSTAPDAKSVALEERLRGDRVAKEVATFAKAGIELKPEPVKKSERVSILVAGKRVWIDQAKTEDLIAASAKAGEYVLTLTDPAKKAEAMARATAIENEIGNRGPPAEVVSESSGPDDDLPPGFETPSREPGEEG